MLRSCFAVALTTALLAQGGPIFVVDANNGPGTSYTDLQTAVLAVPDGSTLLVRPGTYTPIVIDGKGLAIVGDPWFVVAGVGGWGSLLRVENTQVHQRVLVRGLRNGGGITISGTLLRVTNATGPVTLDGVGQPLSMTPWGWPALAWGFPALAIEGSSQVTIRNWTIQGTPYSQAVAVAYSDAVFEECLLQGSGAWIMEWGGWSGQAGLTVDASHVQLVNTTVRGGDGVMMAWVEPGSAAIKMNLGSLRAMGSSSHPLTGGTTPAVGPVAAIMGSGVARIDPLIPLTAAPTGVTLTQATMPSLLADSAPPGGTVTASSYGAPGVLCAVALSLRAPSFILPWLPDPIWLDPQGLIVEAAGITPASGLFVVTKNVPNVATMRGFEFVWQAADLIATGIVAVSNPSPSFVH